MQYSLDRNKNGNRKWENGIKLGCRLKLNNGIGVEIWDFDGKDFGSTKKILILKILFRIEIWCLK